MARVTYKDFLSLLKKWPIDVTKQNGRDLGEHIRSSIAAAYQQGDASPIDEEKCRKIFLSLNAIANDTYSRQYPRTYDSTASGLTSEECKQAISSELLDAINEINSGFITRMKKKAIVTYVQALLPTVIIRESHRKYSLAHIPVMCKEVVDFLKPCSDKIYLDMTFGAGGHSRSLLESDSTVKVIAIDRDPSTREFSEPLQEKYHGRFISKIGRFSELPEILSRINVKGKCFDGILMDLGVSSMQLGKPERGFMVSEDGPLDMRMDMGRFPDMPTASQILEHIDEMSLYKVLKYYGQEKNARKIARTIIESRFMLRSLKTTKELGQLVSSAVGVEGYRDKLGRFSHPATKTFQALRILINNELNELDFAMKLAHFYLADGGILLTLSFHSLEDTVIKRHLTGMNIDETPETISQQIMHSVHAKSLHSLPDEFLPQKQWLPLTKHVVVPSEEEVKANPRSRSAKLRVAQKHPYV